MLRIIDGTNSLQGLTIEVGGGLTLTENSDGLPKLDVTPASPGTAFFSALVIKANTTGGHRQLWLKDHAGDETKNDWLIGTAAGGDDVEITPSTTIPGGSTPTFSNPVIVFKLAGNVGINTRTPGATIPTTWSSDPNARALEISSNGAFDSGLFLRHSTGTGIGLDLWSDQSTGDGYIDLRSTTAGLRIRTKTSGTAVDAIYLAASGTVGVGTTSPSAKAKVHVVGGNLRLEDSVVSGSGLGIMVSPDALNLAENAYYDGAWKNIKTGVGILVQTSVTTGYALLVRVDTATRSADAARTWADLVKVDTAGNTTVLGSGSAAGKLTGNRFILPAGTDLWAT